MASEDMSNALVPLAPPGALAQETATAQSAAMAKAEVEARYVMAKRFPRDPDVVRQALLRECARPTFAAVARYVLPRAGQQIRGPSIRFAEAARRLSGNMASFVSTIFQNDEQQIMRVATVDFETNAIDVEEVVVPRYKEARNPRKGDEVVGARTNSSGETVYRVRTTDDDHRIKRRAETQRAKRNGILALLPGDLIDECMDAVAKTNASAAAKDPDAYRKQVLDSFGSINVPVAELRDYLGHDLGQASPAEMAELGAIYQTIRAGEANWRECLAAKTGIADDGKADPHAGLKRKIAERAAKGAKRRQPRPSGAGSDKGKAPPKESGKGQQAPAASERGRHLHTDEEKDELVAKINAGLTDEEIMAGWEVDPSTGDKVPPPGWEG